LPQGPHPSLKLVIRDVLGQVVRERETTFPSGALPVDLSGLSGGVYHLHVYSERGLLGETLLIVCD